MQLRRIRAAGAVAAGAALFVGMGTGAVGSLPSDGEPVLPLSIDPEEGPPGTAIAVSGDQCTVDTVTLRLSLGEDTLDEQEVTVEDPYDPDPGHDDHGGGLDILRYAGGDGGGGEEPGTGAFTGTLTVPDDDSLVGETLAVSAECNPVYEVASFVVIEPTTPPTPPPGNGGNGGNGGGGNGGNGGAGGGGGTPGTTAPAPAPAPRAAPVSGAPSYTG